MSLLKKKYTDIEQTILLDFVCSLCAWELTSLCRVYFLFQKTSFKDVFLIGDVFWFELIGVPLGWIVLYYFHGDYQSSKFFKNKLDEFKQLCGITLVGCLVVFFVIFLNDVPNPYIDFSYYYVALFTFYLIQLLLVYVGRLILILHHSKQLKRAKHKIPILIISDKQNPYDFVQNTNQKDIENIDAYHIVGVLSKSPSFDKEQYLGGIESLTEVIQDSQVQIVIINLENKESDFLNFCYQALNPLRIELKIVPDIIDIISGNFRSNNVLNLDLIDVHLEILPKWELRVKRLIDIIVSSLSLILLVPLYLFLIVRIKLSDKGPIWYKQERVGYKQVPFFIYKFRTMHLHAEKPNQPQLAQETDPRITSWGRTLRKWRLDETPQFWNVLKGDMSIIGPRPERKYFIEQLEQNGIPFSSLLLRVKPGLSSLGMVRYGYASNIEEMKNRIKFDLIYIEHMSIFLDFKIVLETIQIILQGKGK